MTKSKTNSPTNSSDKKNLPDNNGAVANPPTKLI